MCNRMGKISNNKVLSCLGAFFAVVISSLLMVGCSLHLSDMVPSIKTTDYSTLSCELIWQEKNVAEYNNAFYWLKVMACTKSIDKEAAIVWANQDNGTEWYSLFKQGIMVNYLRPVENQRRLTIARLKNVCPQLSESVCNLMTLWLENQEMQSSLVAERGRYQRLKEATDSQQHELQEELKGLELKLKSLTDIESQLSARKPVVVRDIKTGDNIKQTDQVTESALPSEKKPMPENQPAIKSVTVETDQDRLSDTHLAQNRPKESQ